MFSQCGDIAAQGTQHPQFRGIRVEDCLYQRSHGEISGIQHQGIGIILFCLVDQSLDFGKAPQSDILSVFHGEEAVQMGVGVVEEEDIHLFAGVFRSG